MVTLKFRNGTLIEIYEEQANKQDFTFGDKVEWVQEILGFGLVCAHINGCITDAEYNKILQRFQRKILVKNLRKMEETEE